MSAPVAPPAEHWEAPFEFTGDGAEYFRIWVVNLLLTLVTLGIYSAWAKVRKTRYFWQNTRLAGHVFDFHGRPRAILLGRILALILLLAYTWSFEFSLTAGIVTMCVLLVLGPWLFLKAQQFRLRNTSYRGLRMGFAASLADAYKAVLPPLLLYFTFLVGTVLVTLRHEDAGSLVVLFVPILLLLVLAPALHHRLKAFQHRNATCGDRRFGFESARGAFYKTYLKAIGLTIVYSVVAAIAGSVLLAATGVAEKHATVATIVMVALISLSYVFVLPYISVRMQQVVWRHTFVDAVRFDTAIRVWPLTGLVFRNVTLTLVTLGLYWPFAAVAFARYRITGMRMSSIEPLATLRAGTDGPGGTAFGDAALDGFGIDIGL